MDDPFYKAAINYLSFRPRSIKEVRDYLKKKITHTKKSLFLSSLQKQESILQEKEKIPDQVRSDKMKDSLTSFGMTNGQRSVTESIEKVVSLLQKQHFLDDTAFARAWIHSRTSGKPKSKSFIVRELKEKGVSEEVIATVFQDLQEEIKSDFDQAVLLLEKKFKQYDGLEKEVLYRKAGGYLARRGFSYDVMRKSIDQVFGK